MKAPLGENYDQIMRDLSSRSQKHAGLGKAVSQCEVDHDSLFETHAVLFILKYLIVCFYLLSSAF